MRPADGSALEGADKDYTENRGTLTFEPSETSKTIEDCDPQRRCD